MSHPHSLFYSARDSQRTFDGTEPAVDVYSMSWRDHNINSGPGAFTINNDNRVMQQARSTYRHIRGTEEEEAEYEEYREYKRGDIQLLQLIHRQKTFWHSDCERSIFIGRVVAGDGIGNIVTVEAYGGRDAPKEWKYGFAHYSGQTL
ncbi:hypothetical protein PM082_006173 [Marasmius tenuissimus]|nr:hypothetical protein PM082_006173 [Marasmius tenuissimus]